MGKQLSLTYRFLCTIGLHYSEEEYGDVSLWRVIRQFFGNIYRKQLESVMDWSLITPFAPRLLRPWLLRRIGCHVGKHVFIGDYVRVDLNHADMISIDDHAHITSGCRLLCHQRDLRDYRVGDNAARCGYRKGPICIGKGVMLGMESMVMPGVSIGDGAIIGARAFVTKDIPPYTIAVGFPAKVVKKIAERSDS